MRRCSMGSRFNVPLLLSPPTLWHTHTHTHYSCTCTLTHLSTLKASHTTLDSWLFFFFTYSVYFLNKFLLWCFTLPEFLYLQIKTPLESILTHSLCGELQGPDSACGVQPLCPYHTFLEQTESSSKHLLITPYKNPMMVSIKLGMLLSSFHI